MRVAAILTAAGSGSRLGRTQPKALVDLDGEPLVLHAARGLTASGVVDHLVVTVPAGATEAFGDALAPLGADVTLVEGGSTRQASVAAGMRSLPPDVDVVLVHDAARSLTPPEVVRRVVDALAQGHRCVVPVLPLTDSVVRLDDGGVHPVDRAALRAVQTPQGFERALLEQAHAAASERAADESTAATDDASLCALLGADVVLVDGHPDAMKITGPRDLVLAGAVAAAARRPDDGATVAS